MSILSKSANAPAGSVNSDGMRLYTFSGSFTIGAAGAITTQDGAKASGGTSSKTAAKTGRYDVVLVSTVSRLAITASMTGPADAAFGNAAANMVGIRNVAPTSATSNFELQGILASSGADADFPSGTIVNWVATGYAK